MTYNVFGGTLNLALSLSLQIASVCSIHFDCILGEPCLFLTRCRSCCFFSPWLSALPSPVQHSVDMEKHMEQHRTICWILKSFCSQYGLTWNISVQQMNGQMTFG